MSSRVVLEVENNALAFGRSPGSYDWGRIIQRHLPALFPDLSVVHECSQGKRVVLGIESGNGPMEEDDVRSRIHDFMRVCPAMRVETLQIDAEGGCDQAPRRRRRKGGA